MKFTEQDLVEIQYPRSEHYTFSATHSVAITMENCGDIYAASEKLRRIDGTITAGALQQLAKKFGIEPCEWAHGKVNFDVIAESYNMDRDQIPLPDTIGTALRSATIVGNAVRLPEMAKEDYTKVDKILQALGGKWNRSAKAHTFESKDPDDEIARFLETGKFDPVEKLGFFPTPEATARPFMKKLDPTPDDLLLEPEAGIGGLATIAAEIIGKDRIVCYEIQEKNCATLRQLGFDVVQTDFMHVVPTPRFTLIAMNPPFERQQDIDHVMHAFKFLAPGGRLGAIMSSSITFRKNRKTAMFREFLESVDATITHHDKGAFKESGTLASTVEIFFQRPAGEHLGATFSDAPVMRHRKAEEPALEIGDAVSMAPPPPTTKHDPRQIGFAF